MGSALSACDIDLSEEVISSLIPFTLIPSLKYKEIHNALALHEHINSKLPAIKVFKVLKRYFENPKPLVDTFKTRTGPNGDEFVNVNYLVSSLCFYSKSAGIRKCQCNIYTVLFKLFLTHESRTLKLQELTKLIKSVIIGVYHMIGREFPKSTIYRKLADEFMIFADFKHIKRINSEE